MRELEALTASCKDNNSGSLQPASVRRDMENGVAHANGKSVGTKKSDINDKSAPRVAKKAVAPGLSRTLTLATSKKGESGKVGGAAPTMTLNLETNTIKDAAVVAGKADVGLSIIGEAISISNSDHITHVAVGDNESNQGEVNKNSNSTAKRVDKDDGDSLGSRNKDDTTVLASLGLLGMVGNPKDKKDRNQKRLEPRQVGAPTTKANKVAARQSNRQKRETFKMEQLRNKGKNGNGKKGY